MPVHIAFCTCPDAETADRLAETLVAERLAACVNILPGVHSVYRWQGAIEHDDEVLLLIKTTSARLEAVGDRIQALHPCDVPELVAVDSNGELPAYLQWVMSQTQPVPES